MSKKLKIKAGNISNLTDARYFAAYGVEWMGFNFKKNDTQALQLEDAKTIKNWIVGPTIVAEFDKFNPDYIFEITNQLQTNWIQLPINEYINDHPKDYNVIYRCDFANIKSISEGSNNMFLSEVHNHNEVEAILKLNSNYIFKIVAKFEIQRKIIEKTNLTAIEIEGSEEEKVGLKSFDAINTLFDWLEEKGFI